MREPSPRPRASRQRQRAAHRPQLAGQTQLAGKFIALQRRRVDLSVGGQDAQRDRQVEAPRILRQLGRRQVDGDALVGREGQAALQQRRAHALTRFLDLRVGQANEREAGQAVGQMHFHLHRWRGHAIQSAAHHHGQSHVTPLRELDACTLADIGVHASEIASIEAEAHGPQAGITRRRIVASA